jgi:DNA-binding NarL/FixJ family response regulator
VFFSSHGDASLMEQAFAAGGLGYVLKGSAAEDLPLAIRAALRGETFVSPSLK